VYRAAAAGTLREDRRRHGDAGDGVNMLTYLTLFVVCSFLALLCEHLEVKSRKWYRDRMLLRASGFLAALAVVFLVLGVLA